jgi:hypothetical protein
MIAPHSNRFPRIPLNAVAFQEVLFVFPVGQVPDH